MPLKVGIGQELDKVVNLMWQCMTIPVGVATLFVLPDTPYTTKSRFLTAKECELAIDRVTKAGKAAPAGVTLATFKRVLLKWRWYAFVLGYVVSKSLLLQQGIMCITET